MIMIRIYIVRENTIAKHNPLATITMRQINEKTPITINTIQSKKLMEANKRIVDFWTSYMKINIKVYTLIVRSAEPVQNHVLLGSNATDLTHPK